MLRNNLEVFELEKEFRELALGLKKSFKPAIRISSFIMRSSFKKANQILWWVMEPPKIWEKIGPDRFRNVDHLEKRPLIQASMHPPSHHLLR